MEQDPKAQKRLRVIVDHLGGRITATQAAVELGVSRKTFYEWLDRAQSAMFLALQDRPNGRPEKPVDREKEELLMELEEMEKEREVLENRLRVQEAIRETLQEMESASQSPKKKRDMQTEG